MNESKTLATQDSIGGRGRIDKRTAILDAAYRTFARDGYERTSVDDIAADAGVAKPTIYNHFGGKEALFRQVVLDSAVMTNAATLSAIESLPLQTTNLHQEFLCVGTKLVGCISDPRAMTLQRLMWAEICRFPDLHDMIWSKAATPVIEALAGRLAILANAGYLTVPDPMRAARQFISLISDDLRNISALGTRAVPLDVWEASVSAGVETFLRAYEKR